MGKKRSHTCHAGREGENDDVIEGPAVVRVRRVKGQLTRRLFAQVHQEGGVYHGHGEAALPQTLPDGEVGRRPLVVALRRAAPGQLTLPRIRSVAVNNFKNTPRSVILKIYTVTFYAAKRIYDSTTAHTALNLIYTHTHTHFLQYAALVDKAQSFCTCKLTLKDSNTYILCIIIH